MAEKNVQKVPSGDVLLQAESFWNKYQKQMLIGIAVVLIGIGGWLGYQAFVVQPKEEQASNAIYKAEENFAKDSLKAALNGDAGGRGFLYIINNYGGTKTANLAKYYAGVCYLRTGDYNKAIEYLKDFKTNAKQVQMMAYGCLADAYGELGKNDDAVNFYKKASETFEEDEANASEYLFRAGLRLEVTGKTKEAADVYKKLKEKFPSSQRGGEIDKYIYRLSIEPNDFTSK